MTGKAVLILGRFTERRKEVLESIAQWLRDNDHLPIIMDFPKPKDRNFTETVRTLAGLCKYVIVDLTNPKSVPQELSFTLPKLRMPFIPLLQKRHKSWSLWDELEEKSNVLKPTVMYENPIHLLSQMKEVMERAKTLKKEMTNGEPQYPSQRKRGT
jgi:hypothetical protein